MGTNSSRLPGRNELRAGLVVGLPAGPEVQLLVGNMFVLPAISRAKMLMLMVAKTLFMVVAMMRALVMLMWVVTWRNISIKDAKLTLMTAVVIIMPAIVLWRTWPNNIIVATPVTTAFGLGPCAARFN